MNSNLIKGVFLFFFLNLLHTASSQNTGVTNVVSHFGGAVTVTNNGVSFIPSFNLGKPAAIFDLSVGRNKLSFEPQFRFALEGKPWSFLFWFRYKLLNTGRFQVNLGAHPALSFKTSSFLIDEVSKEYMVVRRYLAGELVPNYSISKNISTGIYYLYSICLDKDVAKNTNFLAARISFSEIRLTRQFYTRFYPQVYYLKMDADDGFYFSSTLTLARRNIPVSISSIINKAIQTQIPGKDFIWNISLIYSFNKEYVKK